MRDGGEGRRRGGGSNRLPQALLRRAAGKEGREEVAASGDDGGHVELGLGRLQVGQAQLESLCGLGGRGRVVLLVLPLLLDLLLQLCDLLLEFFVLAQNLRLGGVRKEGRRGGGRRAHVDFSAILDLARVPDLARDGVALRPTHALHVELELTLKERALFGRHVELDGEGTALLEEVGAVGV